MICFFHSHIELFFAYIFNNYDDHNFAAAVVITICIRILANGQNDCPKILRTQGLEENPNCTNGQRGSIPSITRDECKFVGHYAKDTYKREDLRFHVKLCVMPPD